LDWDAVGAIGEILGAAGVIVTLAYLAIQIKHNSKVTKMSTAQQMADKWVSINLQMMQNSEVVDHDLADPTLGLKEFQASMGLWRAMFHQWSNNHYQYINGVLDEELYLPTGKEIAALASSPESGTALRVAWESARMIYNVKFGEFMDEVLRANPVDAGESATSRTDSI